MLTTAWVLHGIRIRDDVLDGWRAQGIVTSRDEVNARIDAENPPAAREAGRALMAAAAQIDLVPPADDPGAAAWLDDPVSLRRPRSAAELGWTRQLVERNRVPLATIEPLLDGRPIDFGRRYGGSLSELVPPFFERIDEALVVRLLSHAAALDHAAGEDLAALNRVDRMLALVGQYRRASWSYPALADGLTAQASATIESMASTVAIGRDAPRPRAAAQRIVATLLDDVPWQAMIRESHAMRCATAIDDVESRLDSFVKRSAARSIFGDVVREATKTLEGDLAESMAAAMDSNVDALEPLLNVRELAAVPAVYDALRGALRVNIGGPNGGPQEAAFRRRAAATLLALRMFEIDHGRLPGTFEELIPAYLPAVPNDPTARDGRPLWYVNEADVVAIYSPRRVLLRLPIPLPTTMPRDFSPRLRAEDVVVIYRGHDRITPAQRRRK